MENVLEQMDSFFDKRANSYDYHMITENELRVFYDEIEKCIVPNDYDTLFLDLGCGTGLEIERIFNVCRKANITAIDLSKGMLEVLSKKFSDKLDTLKLINASYFDVDLGRETFDYAVSTYSLHHFNEQEKLALYKRIYESLKPNGIYIEGDYTVTSLELQAFYQSENKRIRAENKITEGFYHFDTPLFVDTQVKLFYQAGFQSVEIIKQWEKTTIFHCSK